VAAQLLERRKNHVLSPLSGGALSSGIRDVEELLYCIEHFLADCPQELKLELGSTAFHDSPVATLESGGLRDVPLATELPALPPLGKVSRRSYQAQQANLFVTQVSSRRGVELIVATLTDDDPGIQRASPDTEYLGARYVRWTFIPDQCACSHVRNEVQVAGPSQRGVLLLQAFCADGPSPYIEGTTSRRPW
jgi:hypothetical protein